MGVEAIDRIAKFLKILADANRLRIISAIGKKECSVSGIMNDTGLPQTLVSFHLRILREAGLVETERKGAFIYYRLKDQGLIDLLSAYETYTSDYDSEIDGPPVFCSCPPWFFKKT